MNANTGVIENFSSTMDANDILKQGFIQIEESDLTPEQKANKKVELTDRLSALGIKLNNIKKYQTSKYMPHVGKKQLAKQEARKSKQ